jgi:LmbE family N-acetylglucosaminyl deacetylase
MLLRLHTAVLPLSVSGVSIGSFDPCAKMTTRLLLLFVLVVLCQGLRVLQVQAHADDETAFAGFLFALTHNLNATVDLLVVTDGQGGFAHSLASSYLYHYDLGTNESVARQRLPAIRKEELLCSAKVLMIDNVYFLDQPDVEYTTDPGIVLKKWWNATVVRDTMQYFLKNRNCKYDITLCTL